MQRADGSEIGPLRAYPGGFAVSRAVGDFAVPWITCEPEVTRVKVPKTGARLLVASDGVFAAISDGDISEICATLSSSKECADKIIEKVLELRGRHDDITLLIADIPPPEEYMKLFKATEIKDRLQVSVARKKKTKKELMQLIMDEQKQANQNASDGKGKTDVSFDRVIGEDDYVLQEDDFFIDDVADDITVYGFRGTRQQRLVFDEYQIGALLGRGAFGSVRIAVRRETGDVCGKIGAQNLRIEKTNHERNRYIANCQWETSKFTHLKRRIPRQIERTRDLLYRHGNLRRIFLIRTDYTTQMVRRE